MLFTRQAFIQWFIDNELTSKLVHPSLMVDAILAVRAKLYALIAVAISVSIPFVAYPYFEWGHPWLGALGLSFALIAACAVIVMRRVGSMPIATHLLCTAIWGANVSGYFVLGGMSSYINKWFLVVVVIAIFSNHKSVGIFWAAVCFITPIIVNILFESGALSYELVFPESQMKQMDFANSLLFLGAISMFMWIVHLHHIWLTRRLKQDEAILTAQHVQLADAHEKAMSAMHARDRFMANMSHELRTPLNAMIGYSEMIQEDLEDQDNSMYDEDFLKIRQAGDELLNMLHDILELTHFESSPVKLPLDPIRPIKLMRGLANTDDLISLDAHESWQHTALRTHEQTLERLILKLLENAVKFAGSHGDITMKLTPIDAQGGALEVIDQGPGIPQKYLDEVWLPFSQADISATRMQDGAGLGLSLVRHYAEALGLTVSIESSAEQGTCVRCHFPTELFTSPDD